jgi:hypothetical protein
MADPSGFIVVDDTNETNFPNINLPLHYTRHWK